MGVAGFQRLDTERCNGRQFVQVFNDNMTIAVTAADLTVGQNLERSGRTYRVKISATGVNTTGRLATDSTLTGTGLGSLMNTIKAQIDALQGWNMTAVGADLESIETYKRSAQLLIAQCNKLVTKAARLGTFLEVDRVRFDSHTHDAKDFVSGVFLVERLGENPTPTTFLSGNSMFN